MKKHIFILLLIFAMPVLVHPVTEEGITITKFSMEPVPFNERRDPAADSPYNAFDGDVKTAALYSGFSMEFSKPVTIDSIKIMNGNASGKDSFKKSNRERDIEIILYTVAVKSEKKAVEKKKKKPSAAKKDDKKASVKDKEVPVKDKEAKDKTEPGKTEKDKIEKDSKKKDSKEKEKKPDTPEKIVNKDEYETPDQFWQDDVKLYLTASETVIAQDTKPVEEKKQVEKKKPEAKKPDKKKAVKAAPVKKKTSDKKTAVRKPVSKKAEAKKDTGKKAVTKPVNTTVKEKAPDKNIIEITDSKKDKQVKPKEGKAADKKNNEAVKKITEPANVIKPAEVKESVKEEKKTAIPYDEDESVKIQADKPLEKIAIPEIKKTVQKKNTKKQAVKVKRKPEVQKKAVNDKVKSEKKVTDAKKTDRNKIEIIDSKKKTEKEKLPAADKNKLKPDTAEKETVKEKKPEVKKEAKKDIKKEEKKEEKKPEEKISVKKMTGIVRIENDSAGRVLVYASLKDSMDFQNIDLKGRYAVTKIDFRTRDDEYYAGSESDRSGITEIGFFNGGKRIPVLGIDQLKKSYAERYSKTLAESLSGGIFIMYENNEVVLRMTFKKDGSIEFYDRFKCSKKGDADCTSLSMPDRWRITDGRLLMRYHTLWRVWKYELDSQSDMLSDDLRLEPPRWMKIYYKSDNGFTDKYLDLIRSEDAIWAR
jgi:hypothetical protein